MIHPISKLIGKKHKKNDTFFIKKGKKAVLMLHMMGQSPNEFKELASYLTKRNITVYSPLLSGHGKNLKELSNTGWDDWYKNSEDALKFLLKNYKDVYICGGSTTALIALKLATKYKIKGIIALSPSLFLWKKWLNLNFLEFIYKIMKTIGFKNARGIKTGSLKNKALRKKVVPILPINNLISLIHAIPKIKKILPKIKQPILLIHGMYDNRAAPYSSKYIYDNIGSKNKKIVWLENSGHYIISDMDKNKVFKEVYNFIKTG